ncbi:MAG: aldehyde dehydrogenase family protein, partial [Ignavibacteria bacterium]
MFVATSHQRTFENINPADRDDIIGTFPLSTSEDVNSAVKAAKDAFI